MSRSSHTSSTSDTRSTRGTSITRSQRYREISRVLARHGLGYLVGLAGWNALIPFHRGLLGHPRRDIPYTPPEHVRMALEELGAVAIKLGQMLSTRPDVIPPAYQKELARLQDSVPSAPGENVREILAAALGRPVEAIFASVEETPIAAASIGQVYAATLRDGTEVVVKLRRPGVVAQVEADLAILEHLAQQASAHMEVAARYDVEGLVAEFSRITRAELDYRQEGRNAERFARNFADDPNICIPRVYWEATTTSALTLSRLHGIKISDTEALTRAGHDRPQLARRAAQIVLRMIFEHGFYHADPHPGNFVVTADDNIGLMDFGMVGAVSPRLRRRLAAAMIAVASRDTNRLVDTLLDLGFAAGPINRVRFGADLERLLERTYDVPLGEIALTPLLHELLALLQQYQLRLPLDLSLLLKAMLMNESLGTLLDPTFQLTSVLVPYAQKLVMRQYAPEQWARQLGAAGDDFLWLGAEFPQQFRRLVSDMERGALQIGPQPDAFLPLMSYAERIANRLVVGMLAAAFVIGLAILMAVYHPGNTLAWVTAFFVVGLAMVGALGLSLAWAMLRSRRRR